MKAVRIHEHGGPEVLRLDEVDEPIASRGQVLVRVLGVSINHLDLWVRRGMPGFPVDFPRVLGCDGTGEIVAVGEGVTAFRPGQKVVLEPGYTVAGEEWDQAGQDHLAPDYSIRGEHGDGFDVELVAIDARYVFPLPDGLDPVQAAAVPLAFLTAWGMIDRAQLEAGETILVLGAASGVGSAAVQIARHMGARVLATAGTEGKRALACELGAEQAIDHYHEDWPKEVKRLTDGLGADVVVEHIGPATWAGSMRSLARLGRLVTCGGTTGPKVSIALPHLFMKNQSVLGSTMGPRTALPIIFDHVARGHYRPVVDSVVPMSAVRDAHEKLEAKGASGKIVLEPGK